MIKKIIKIHKKLYFYLYTLYQTLIFSVNSKHSESEYLDAILLLYFLFNKS